MNSVIEETWIPALAAWAMTGPERVSTSTAGMSVRNGARSARYASTRSTRMNSNEKV